MNAKPPSRPKSPRTKEKQPNRKSSGSSSEISRTIVDEIAQLSGFSEYGIRQMVTRASEFGRALNQGQLKTNQIRKFLDAINRVKAQVIEAGLGDDAEVLPVKIEGEIVLLKPKLAYAAARQKAAIPLSKVMSAAIDKTITFGDFNQLVQFIESVIAYHKAEGGE